MKCYLEHILNKVSAEMAREVQVEFSRAVKVSDDPETWPDVHCYDFSILLKRRLLPLLEAGQEFRQKAVVINLKTRKVDLDVLEAMNKAWDSAL